MARTLSIKDPKIQKTLTEVFGIEAFRDRQAEAVQAVLEGRDILLTMPTGAGKSLAYQLPAVVLDGLTLVVSPLIALMKDQVDALQARGVAATFVNSSISAGDRRKRLDAAVRGDLDLLFVTPERFRSPTFQEVIPELPITRLAVDEAHCISQWGHDYRPDYTRLGEYRARVGDPPCLALTATATPDVAEDIARSLRLQDPVILRTGIERPNLYLGATAVADKEEKFGRIAERIAAIDGPGIVYSTLIRDLEALHGELQRRGIPSLVYHGKLSAEERREMQDRFMTSKSDVVLATNAFGMGVDKADIRFVLHAQLPRTLEAWTQEVGRAGRDGHPSLCELLYLEEDVAIQQNFIKWANPTREYFLGVYEALAGWGERIQTRDLDDLRGELLHKDLHDNRVQICLNWLEVLGITSGSFETHDLRLARELDPAQLPPSVGSEKKRAHDLEALLGMVQFAKDHNACRRVLLAQHFGLPEPESQCGACDACSLQETWMQGKVTARASQPVDPDERTVEFRRGDWVRMDGRHLGQVLRVEGSGRSLRLTVEDATDLRRRVVNPSRRQVERLDQD